MKYKKTPIILTASFFVIMLILTFSARAIHNSMIPNVKIRRLTREKFEHETILEDGVTVITQSMFEYAISKDLYDSGNIYIITTGEKNGDERTFAKAFEIEIGHENEDYYEVKNRLLDNKLRFIIYSSESINDGDEVFVIE